ncbi:hypothetical protein DFH09DRAFT_1324927 [Mycena vulgaris]|nr:hypothetical protein DFH09DRAFT_1324927 [Mycena vulgaris]
MVPASLTLCLTPLNMPGKAGSHTDSVAISVIPADRSHARRVLLVRHSADAVTHVADPIINAFTPRRVTPRTAHTTQGDDSFDLKYTHSPRPTSYRIFRASFDIHILLAAAGAGIAYRRPRLFLPCRLHVPALRRVDSCPLHSNPSNHPCRRRRARGDRQIDGNVGPYTVQRASPILTPTRMSCAQRMSPSL